MYIINKEDVGYRVTARGQNKSRLPIVEAWPFSIVIPRTFRQARDFIERNGHTLIVSKDALPENEKPFALIERNGFGRVVTTGDWIVNTEPGVLKVISEEKFHNEWIPVPKVHESHLDKLIGGRNNEESKKE